MFGTKIALDLGTSYVSVYTPRGGVVLREPNVVALDTDTQRIVAIGDNAKQMLGRTPDTIVAREPLKDGVIADFRITQEIIRYYLNKVAGGFRLIRPDVMITVPAGATSTERRAVIDATLAAGARAAYIIRQPVAAALGAGIPIASATGNMVVTLGGGITEIAILSLGGVVAQQSTRVGGKHIDAAIAEGIRKSHNLGIGAATAEDIKMTAASALIHRQARKIDIRGRDVVAGLPKTISVSSTEITESIEGELEQIVLAIRTVLEKTPPELSSDIIDRGMILTGGTAQLAQLDKLLAKVTGVPCIVAEDAETCVVRGAGLALGNLEAYKRSLASLK